MITSVRNMLGFTGTYKGVKVTVMASGMGMPSIGIYSWELYTSFGVENIIRVGSAGSYKDWKYVQAGDGVLWLDVPEEAGSYEIRYYTASRASEENLAGGLRVPFLAVGEKPGDDQAVYPARNDFDWDLLTFAPGLDDWTGAYETNFGTMYLRQSGGDLTGEYPSWDDGRVDGTVRDGIFYGYWYESPSYAPPGDAG